MEPPRVESVPRPTGPALNDLGGLRSAMTWTYVLARGACAMAMAAAVLLAGGWWWDRDRRWPHRIAVWWGAGLARTLPFSVELRGLERARGGPFVIVANHQSVVDLLVTYLLPLPYRTVVRRDLFFTPMGFNMWAAGYVPTPRRGRPGGVQRLRADCARVLGRGLSVLLFPEGERAHGWSLGRFRPFAFDLAESARVPVLPVALAGTNDVGHPSTWRFSYGRHVIVEVLDPLPSDGGDAQRLLAASRAALVDHVARLRAELRARFAQGPS